MLSDAQYISYTIFRSLIAHSLLFQLVAATLRVKYLNAKKANGQ